MTLSKEKERLNERILRMEHDIEGLETELNVSRAKVELFRSELAGPMITVLTAEAERLIESLSLEVDRRRKNLIELRKATHNVCGRCLF